MSLVYHTFKLTTLLVKSPSKQNQPKQLSNSQNTPETSNPNPKQNKPTAKTTHAKQRNKNKITNTTNQTIQKQAPSVNINKPQYIQRL